MASSDQPNAVLEWWGEGPAPTELWPGVTIPIDEAGGKFYFDDDKAKHVCDFFPKYCSHSKGAFAGDKFELLPYQIQLILRPLFGWMRTSDKTRRFRKAYIEIPKKNGKTQLIAGLALYMLLGDNEPGAEVYVAAADREQARILFRAASAMVESNQALTKRLQVFRNSIVRKDDPTAFFQVLSADAATKHGPNIHCLIIDELHAQPDRELFETLTRGIIARRQPLILLITTAGDDDESICYEEYEYAKRVLNGTIQDDQHLPVIFEAKPEDDYMSPEVWKRVNPAFGKTFQEDSLAAFALEAQNEPRKRNDFLRYHLNRWVNQATAWIPNDWWDACRGELDADHLRTLPVSAGLDMSQKLDLTAFVLTFREMVKRADRQEVEVVTGGDKMTPPLKKKVDLNYRVYVVPFFWIPEDTMLEHEKEDGLPYSMWAEQKNSLGLPLITVTEGGMIDYTQIYEDIVFKIMAQFPLLKQGFIGYDPSFADDVGQRLRTHFGEKGKDKVLEVLQNYNHMSEPCHIIEALIKTRRLVHDGHRILRLHVDNCAVKRDDAGRIRPVKPKSHSKRIDGIVASVMGISHIGALPVPKMRTGSIASVWTPEGFKPASGTTQPEVR